MIDHGYKVKLGPLDRAQLETVRRWRNDYEVWRWCRQNDLISDMDQERWYVEQSKDPSIRMYGIYGGNKLVGVCGLTSIDLYNRRAEFSLYIGPEHQGSNYGEAALRTLLAHGFKTLGLNCIWGETFEGNPAAKTFEKIGFTREGARRSFYFREGKFIDAILYSILCSDWLDKLHSRTELRPAPIPASLPASGLVVKRTDGYGPITFSTAGKEET